jgi:hypothetical protein
LIHIDLDTLSKMAEDSFKAIDPRDLAFLFASGKSEGFMRDQLGLFLSRNLSFSSDEHVTREWKKHDLTVMNGNQPLILVEGKSWICHDAYRKSKLLTDKKSIFQGSIGDVKKLLNTHDQYPKSSIFISTIIYGVDTSMNRDFARFNITYGDSHNKGIQSAGNFSNLVGISRSHASTLHGAFGPTRRFPLRAGSFHGMNVEADFFLTQIISSPSKNLKKEIIQSIFE